MTAAAVGQSPRASILAVLAHPDDAELWAGGALALHAQTAPVTIAVPANTPARMDEARVGAGILGASLHVLPSAPDTRTLEALLDEIRPERIITHPVADVHPRHRAVAVAVLDALPHAVIATGRPRRVYMCDTYNSLTLDGPTPARTIVDITETFDVKMRALGAHGSTQPIDDHFGPMAENLARLWGGRIGVRYAEAFIATPVLGRIPGVSAL